MNDKQLTAFLDRFNRYPGEPLPQKITNAMKATVSRPPRVGEYADPQPSGVDIAGDEA